MNAGTILLGVLLLLAGLAALVWFGSSPATLEAMGGRFIVGTLGIVLVVSGIAVLVQPQKHG